jgi:hypothetical protein
LRSQGSREIDAPGGEERRIVRGYKWKKGCNTTRSTVVPLLSTDSGSIGLVFEVRMGFGIFPMIWSHPSQELRDRHLNQPGKKGNMFLKHILKSIIHSHIHQSNPSVKSISQTYQSNVSGAQGCRGSRRKCERSNLLTSISIYLSISQIYQSKSRSAATHSHTLYILHTHTVHPYAETELFANTHTHTHTHSHTHTHTHTHTLS